MIAELREVRTMVLVQVFCMEFSLAKGIAVLIKSIPAVGGDF